MVVRICMLLVLAARVGAMWPFSSSSAKPVFSLGEYASGEWTFDIMQSQSSPQGFASVKNWTVALTAVQEENNVVLVDSLKKRRIVFDMSSGDAGVVQMVRPALPQPSETIEIKPPAAADDEDEFEEFGEAASAKSSPASTNNAGKRCVALIHSTDAFSPSCRRVQVGRQ
jgi:hypothetical protein